MKTALVTGGSRGIGLGIARALARDAWSLAICGVRPEADVKPVLDELRQHGTEVYYRAADLAQPGDRGSARSTRSSTTRDGRRE